MKTNGHARFLRPRLYVTPRSVREKESERKRERRDPFIARGYRSPSTLAIKMIGPPIIGAGRRGPRFAVSQARRVFEPRPLTSALALTSAATQKLASEISAARRAGGRERESANGAITVRARADGNQFLLCRARNRRKNHRLTMTRRKDAFIRKLSTDRRRESTFHRRRGARVRSYRAAGLRPSREFNEGTVSAHSSSLISLN